MKKLLLTLLGALCIAPAFAATSPYTLTWTRPTTYVDGSALPASAITGFRTQCTLTPTGGTATPCTFTPTGYAGSVLTGTGTLTYPPQGGRACFAIVVDVGSLSSDPSEIGPNSCLTLAPIRPSPPGPVTVTITVAVNIDVNGIPLARSMVGPVSLTEIEPR